MSIFNDFRRGFGAGLRGSSAAQPDYAAAKGRRDDIRPEIEGARPARREYGTAEHEARLRELLQQDARSRALRRGDGDLERIERKLDELLRRHNYG